jgi:hypothetical protein
MAATDRNTSTLTGHKHPASKGAAAKVGEGTADRGN